MPDEVTQQDYYPKALDPWLIDLMGRHMYSQLVGEDFEKEYHNHRGEKLFQYNDIILTKDNAKSIIKRMFSDATWETIAMSDGVLKINIYNGKEVIALMDGAEFYRSPVGELMTSFDIVDQS